MFLRDKNLLLVEDEGRERKEVSAAPSVCCFFRMVFTSVSEAMRAKTGKIVDPRV